MVACPICELADQIVRQPFGDVYFVECDRCGKFHAARELVDDLPAWLRTNPSARQIMSQLIKLSDRPLGQASRPYTNYDLEAALKMHVPATVDEQASNLLLSVARRVTDAGKGIKVSLEELQSEIRSMSREGVAYLLRELQNEALLTWQGEPSINFSSSKKPETLQLTFEGWRKAGLLKSSNANSKTAFMAMKFGEVELDKLVAGDLNRTGIAGGRFI